MDTAWEPPDGPVVGVIEPESADVEGADVVETLTDCLEDCGGTLREGSAAALRGDVSLLVAVGETALSAAARERVEVPVLPVGDVDGIESVPPTLLPDALEAVLSGAAGLRQPPVFEVALTGERYRGLFDATLVTEEPARISEYGVRSRDELVASFRADGVVVATPAGTHGYAGAVDAPVLFDAVEAVAVAPIAPFTTRTRQWVLPEDGIELTVERDEGAVCLAVDEQAVATVPVGTPVRLDVEGALRVLVPSTTLQP
jgi:NAD+ kinase